MVDREENNTRVGSLQVPAVSHVPNEGAPVSTQQQLGLSQMISGQQLQLLVNHIQEEPERDIVVIPDIQTQQESSAYTTTPTSSQTKKGRPNKYIVLENGEVVKQDQKSSKDSKKPTKSRGRPRKESDTEEKKKSKGRRRKSKGDSDEGTMETEERVVERSERSKLLRRRLTKNKKFNDFEVETTGLPQRPENVWISDEVGIMSPNINIKLEAMNLNQEGSKSAQESENDVGPVAKDNPVTEGMSQDEFIVPEENPVPPKKKRGRKKGTKVVIDDEVLPELNFAESNDLVKCGSCSIQIPRLIFKTHQNNKHNGLAWIEGEDAPIDFRDTTIENQNYLSNLVREAFTRKSNATGKSRHSKQLAQPSKYLSCERCGHRVHSALGYLSHFRFCGVSLEERAARMWKCDLCCRVMMPSSRYAHEQSHRMMQTTTDSPPVLSEENVVWKTLEGTTSRKPRRRAAVKADTYIQVASSDSIQNLYRVSMTGVEKDESKSKSDWEHQLEIRGVAYCHYVGCRFSSSDTSVLFQHCRKECVFRPVEVFECLQCSVHGSSANSIMKHIEEFHPNNQQANDPDHEPSDQEADELSDSCEVQEEITDKRPTTKLRKTKPVAPRQSNLASRLSLNVGYCLNFLAQYAHCRGKVPYKPALTWTIEMRSQQDFSTIIFPMLTETKPAFVRRKIDLEPFLAAAEISISFCFSNDVSNFKCGENFIKQKMWQSLQAYAGSIKNKLPIFFAGGPVSAMAWCPTPFEDGNEQLLAVTCHRSMGPPPEVYDVRQQPGVVQIWSFGDLNNEIDSVTSPNFILGLCHLWGVVRQLAWCPSGCWAPTRSLYGLLAAACSDGTVRLFPVPKVAEYYNQFIDTQASLTLLPFALVHRKCPCVRVSWSVGEGHNVIAGGFTDGLVCLWKISGCSQLLRHTADNGEERLFPYLKFQAHSGPITALQLCPFDVQEPKYVLTGSSIDKSVTYWDLEKLGETSIGGCVRKAKVTSSTWFNLWPTAAVGFEDLQQGTTLVPPRTFCRHCMILPQNSSVLSLDKSDWLNGIVQSTVAGEVSLNLTAQVVFGMDSEKFLKDKRALLTRTFLTSSTLDLQSNENFMSYSEAHLHGVVFCDVNLDTDNAWCNASKSAQLPETMHSSSSVNYPLTSINQVAWNPNCQSFGWIAAGYQCGIVRLLLVKCKSTNETVKQHFKNTNL